MSLGDPAFGKTHDRLVAENAQLRAQLQDQRACEFPWTVLVDASGGWRVLAAFMAEDAAWNYAVTQLDVRVQHKGVCLGHKDGYEQPFKACDGSGLCAPQAWDRGILHEHGHEGGMGLLVPREEESNEECIQRWELSPLASWREVRVRHPRLEAPESLELDYTIESLVEQLDEWLSEGGQGEWFGDYEEPLVEATEGARSSLRTLVEHWASRHVKVHLWEIHPDDLYPPNVVVLTPDISPFAHPCHGHHGNVRVDDNGVRSCPDCKLRWRNTEGS